MAGEVFQLGLAWPSLGVLRGVCQVVELAQWSEGYAPKRFVFSDGRPHGWRHYTLSLVVGRYQVRTWFRPFWWRA